ncbi:MAG: type II toxin-antitoxin system RelE/ParE family toxin [Candidatus Methylomirabilota bacterium]
MTYRLVYTRRAVRDIVALDPKTKARIGTQLERFEEDPLRHAEPLAHSSLGSFRFRIGDYRVVFDLEGEEIVILRVGHRREIYRR